MVCKLCPSRRHCWDKGSCESCEIGKAFNGLDAKIKKLQKKNEILSKNADTAFQDGLNEAQDLYKEQIKSEVARKIFAEIEDLLREWFDHFRQGGDIRESCAIMAALSQVTELKKKYTEGEK